MKTKASREWEIDLSPHPRFTFHFTPTSCSWINAVEGFFATRTKRRLKRGIFRSITDLQGAINRFLDEHNEKAKAIRLEGGSAPLPRCYRTREASVRVDPL
jgi:transposase